MATYYAVIHGEPGFQRFAPMRTKPAISQECFTFAGPEIESDEALVAYFAMQFLPLRVVIRRAGSDVPMGPVFSQDLAYTEARMFAGVIGADAEGVQIVTADGRQLWARE